jgi:hypothetical protein
MKTKGKSMINERALFQIGSISAMLGVVISIFSTMLGPMNLDSHDIRSVLQTFASQTGRLQLHGLGVSLGSLFILGGFIALQRSLQEGTAGAWARFGLLAAIVSTVLHLLGAMMGGSVLPALAEAYMQASPEQSTAALQVGGGFYTFYEALLAPTFLTLAATTLTFAIALVLEKRYPIWLGWAAVIPGIWTAAGGVAFVLVGPMGAADIMLLFVPGFMLSIVWIFVVGIYLWSFAKNDPSEEILDPTKNIKERL